jgi:hypothetical protein
VEEWKNLCKLCFLVPSKDFAAPFARNLEKWNAYLLSERVSEREWEAGRDRRGEKRDRVS